jgi:hypothetical protein
LLVLDNAPGHPAHLDDFHPDVKVVFLPPNTTLLIQPMDQGVMANFKAYHLHMTFVQALAAMNRDTDMTLRDFWKSYNIYQGILNIAKAWQEVIQNCLNSVWKKNMPPVCAWYETYEEVTDKNVQLAEQPELEVGANDVEEKIESHGNELSNEDLTDLEAAKVAEATQAEASQEPEGEPRRFITKEMTLAFREIASAMARFEKMDPNAARFLKVQRGVDDMLTCYKDIYEEKKKTSVQSSLDKFVRKIKLPVSSTSPQSCTSQQPSTSQKSSTTSAADVDLDDDLVPLAISPSSSSSN